MEKRKKNTGSGKIEKTGAGGNRKREDYNGEYIHGKTRQEEFLEAKKPSNWRTKRALYLLAVLLAVLALLMAALSVSEKRGEKMEKIEDKCSVLMGNLIHQMKDEPSCRISCRNYCGTQEMEYARVVFQEFNDRCNSCECYCA